MSKIRLRHLLARHRLLDPRRKELLLRADINLLLLAQLLEERTECRADVS